jgi:hypothetical protein
LRLRAQDDASATWAPSPSAADYLLDATMSARGAFNFVRGVRERGEPLRVVVEGAEAQIDDVLSYHTDPRPPTDRLAGVARLRFRDGVLLARVSPYPGRLSDPRM